MLDLTYYAAIGLIAFIFALGIAHFMFRGSNRGLSASQYLFVAFVWFIIMVFAYIWDVYLG